MESVLQADLPPNMINLSLEEMQSAVGFIPGGLSEDEAKRRIIKYGYNEIASEKPLETLQCPIPTKDSMLFRHF